MSVSDIIKSRRKELGLTLEDIAKKVGVVKSTVAKWENGYIANVGSNKLQALAEILGISVSELIIDDYDGEDKLVNNDPELTEYLEELKNRPELRMMFSLTKSATKADVEQAVAIVEAFLRAKGNNNE